MSNTNCLEGWKCPYCRYEDHFHIDVKTGAIMYDNGTEDDPKRGDTNYEGDYYCRCDSCGHEGVIADFCIHFKEPSTHSKTMLEALKDFVAWWDEWNESEEPHNVGDPDIEGARKLISDAND